jgi:hypothetical protein
VVGVIVWAADELEDWVIGEEGEVVVFESGWCEEC